MCHTSSVKIFLGPASLVVYWIEYCVFFSVKRRNFQAVSYIIDFSLNHVRRHAPVSLGNIAPHCMGRVLVYPTRGSTCPFTLDLLPGDHGVEAVDGLLEADGDEVRAQVRIVEEHREQVEHAEHERQLGGRKEGRTSAGMHVLCRKCKIDNRNM